MLVMCLRLCVNCPSFNLLSALDLKSAPLYDCPTVQFMRTLSEILPVIDKLHLAFATISRSLSIEEISILHYRSPSCSE